MADTEIIRNELREKLRKSIEVTNVIKMPSGGQSVGRINSEICLICNDLGVKIEIGVHRSMYKNRELALNLFELILLEVT